MSAVITDKFRISNADNFVQSVLDSSNNYYVFLGLSNPTSGSKFGRTGDWETNTPSPTDNLQYLSHYKDTILFGKKVNSSNVRRAVRKVQWTSNKKYDMYRHDYSGTNLSPNKSSARLYDADYYVITSEFRVYICLDNGSSGSNPTGNPSKDEPSSTGLEPFTGPTNDGYVWKYLFTVNPSDIEKFDSTEFITLPNNWSTSDDFKAVRENGDSVLNNNQLKTVYIENGGSGYPYTGSQTFNILGDGTGATVSLTFNSSGTITDATIITGGTGYTYGIVDLKISAAPTEKAKLIPIIPPSRGHGYNIYEELGSDRVLLYGKFSSETGGKEFPDDSKFAQIGLLKNPEQSTSTNLFTEDTFSGLKALRLSSAPGPGSEPEIGDVITQTVTDGIAKGYVASYDSETRVLKYYQDRSLYFSNGIDQEDSTTTSTDSKVLEFGGTNVISPLNVTIDQTQDSSTLTVGSKNIDLGLNFQDGVANSEINNNTGQLLYIDNRKLISRDPNQKEEIKIILEF